MSDAAHWHDATLGAISLILDYDHGAKRSFEPGQLVDPAGRAW
ncbi:hypothetical protein RLEG12_07685 (plasmid) [Rhizobium leguminosarum bv. trifolii CB782]|nr:hypothetical protein RLEG12_07685 [Rhizobium leguminosarum bv. trifolii CB782]